MYLGVIEFSHPAALDDLPEENNDKFTKRVPGNFFANPAH
jgi:hypothetical protein